MLLDLSSMPSASETQVNSADIRYIPEKRLIIIPTFNDHRLLAYSLVEGK